MANNLDLKVVISTVDKFTAPFLAMSQRAAQMSKQSGMSDIARGLGGLTKQLAVVGGIGGAAAGGLVAFAKKAASAGDNIAKTADKLGLGVGELQKFRHAAELGGVSTQTFDMAYQRFSRRAAEAFAGGGEAKDALEWLGIDLADADGQIKPTQDLLAEVADQMAKIEDPAQRVRVAFKLFDSEGVSMVNMLKGGSEGLAEAGLEAEKLGLITEEQARQSEAFSDEWLRMSRSVSQLGMQIGMALLPQLQKLITSVRNWMSANRELILTRVSEWIALARDAAVKLVDSFNKLASSPVVSWAMELVNKFGALQVVGTALAAFLGAKLLTPLLSLGLGFAKLSAFMLATPFGWVVLAIGALVAAGWHVYKNWDSIKAKLMAAWQAMVDFGRSIWQGLIDFLQVMWAPVEAAFGQFGSSIRELLNLDLGQVGSEWLAELLSGVQASWDALVIWWQGAMLALSGMLLEIDWLQAGLDWVAGLLNGITQGWAEIEAWLKQAAGELLSFLPDFMVPDALKTDGGSEDSGADNAVAQLDSGAAQESGWRSLLPGFLGGSDSAEDGGSLTAPAQKAADVSGQIKVEFENAPSNMRVKKVEGGGPLRLSSNTGYAMGGIGN